MIVRAAMLLLFSLCVSASAASAADERTAAVGGIISAMNIDAETALSFSGSFEYRFTRVVGLEVEASVTPKLKSPFPDGYTILPAGSSFNSGAVIAIYPPPTYTNRDGRAIIFSNNVRVTIPTTAARLEPYFLAGGGIASVRHTADLVYNPFPLAGAPNVTGLGLVLPTRPITQHLAASSIDLALTLGGGLGVRAASQLWIDADLRLIRLLGNTDRNVGRFGVGVRYRF